MASLPNFHSGPVAVAGVPDGLHVPADWEDLSPTTAVPYPPSSLPAVYSTPDQALGYYEVHDPSFCIHARLLCEERFATLSAQVADLNDYCKRFQCRCGQTAWGRTKSFFGNIKQRVSIKPRKKSQHVPEKERQAEDPDWASEAPSPSVTELPVPVGPAKLPPGSPTIAELAAGRLSACSPRLQAGQIPQTASSFHHSGAFERFGCNRGHELAGRLTVHPNTMPGYPTDQVAGAYELAGQSPNAESHTAPRFPSLGHTPFCSVSTMSQYSASTPASHSFVSPQSSISSASTSSSTATTSVGHGGPLFAGYTTSSPVEYGQDANDVAPWLREPAAAHQPSWDSATTAAELPGSLPISELDASQSPEEPAPQTTMTHMHPPIPALEQAYEGVQCTEPLATGAGEGFALESNPWHAPQVANVVNGLEPAATWLPMGSPFQPRTSAFPSEPLASHQRRNSWDSTASTALDVLMSDDSSGVAPLETAQPPPAPAFFDLPSQQHNKPANSQSRTPIKRKNPKTHHHQQQQKQPQQHQQERVGCTHCGYFPDKGPDQRKKLARHELTDKHRRNTGQDAVGEAGRFPCPRCRTTFNRQDNLWQHVRKKHGRHRSVEGLRGRRKAAWRAMEQSPRLGVLLAEVPA